MNAHDAVFKKGLELPVEQPGLMGRKKTTLEEDPNKMLHPDLARTNLGFVPLHLRTDSLVFAAFE